SAAVASVCVKVEFRIYNGALPLTDVSCAMRFKRVRQRLEQLGRRALIASTERNGNCEFTAVWNRYFARQRDVPVFRCGKFPFHFEMLRQVLPTVAEADVADRPADETGIACDDQMNVLSLSAD